MKRRTVGGFALIAACFCVGSVWGQDKGDLQERFKAVRREIKHIDLQDAIQHLPGLLQRENDYAALLKAMKGAGGDKARYKTMLESARELKLKALDELNVILKRHKSAYTSISEKEVWARLAGARFSDVEYHEEWLVNILDDLEEKCQVNIELDARIYKFDTVTFQFDKTSARAMLQMMGDELLFNWVIRGDTIYVYKERHEVLFGGEWIRRKKAAFKARQDALKKAQKEAERRALEGNDK